MNILEKARQFGVGATEILEWLGTGGEVVSKEVAQERADICNGTATGKKCHQNAPSGFVKDSIAGAARRALDAKNKMQLRVRGEKELGSCETCGCVLKLLVWYPQKKIQPFMNEEELRRTPHHCWKLRKPE